MVSAKIKVTNPSGLHARPASVLAHVATQCDSDIKILYGDKSIQAKSILNIMAAAIKSGSEIELQCSGVTEQEDLQTLAALIESGLGE